MLYVIGGLVLVGVGVLVVLAIGSDNYPEWDGQGKKGGGAGN